MDEEGILEPVNRELFREVVQRMDDQWVKHAHDEAKRRAEEAKLKSRQKRVGRH